MGVHWAWLFVISAAACRWKGPLRKAVCEHDPNRHIARAPRQRRRVGLWARTRHMRRRPRRWRLTLVCVDGLHVAEVLRHQEVGLHAVAALRGGAGG
jgi:hypothetical protein